MGEGKGKECWGTARHQYTSAIKCGSVVRLGSSLNAGVKRCAYAMCASKNLSAAFTVNWIIFGELGEEKGGASDSIYVYVYAIFYAFVCLSLLKCVRKYDDTRRQYSLLAFLPVYPAGGGSDIRGYISYRDMCNVCKTYLNLTLCVLLWL